MFDPLSGQNLKKRLFNPDDWNGMTEEYAFEADAGGVLSVPGTGIAYQIWS